MHEKVIERLPIFHIFHQHQILRLFPDTFGMKYATSTGKWYEHNSKHEYHSGNLQLLCLFIVCNFIAWLKMVVHQNSYFYKINAHRASANFILNSFDISVEQWNLKHEYHSVNSQAYHVRLLCIISLLHWKLWHI